MLTCRKWKPPEIVFMYCMCYTGPQILSRPPFHLSGTTYYLSLFVCVYVLYVCMYARNKLLNERKRWLSCGFAFVLYGFLLFFFKNFTPCVGLYVHVCMYVCMCIHLSMYVHVILTIITIAIFIFFTKSRPASLSLRKCIRALNVDREKRY